MPAHIPVHAIVHARMSSARLPGKVLRKVHGIPLLGHLLDRLEHCDGLDGVVVATSDTPLDDAVAAYATDRGVGCFRGSLDDVAGRLVATADHYNMEHLVRINGDSPMLDATIVGRAVAIYRSEQPDLVTNVQQRTFPKGQSVEVFSRRLLANACHSGLSTSDREHVTPFFYRHPNQFTIRNIVYSGLRGDVQLSVDTEQDLARFERITGRLGAPYWQHGLEAIMTAFDSMDETNEKNA